MIEYTGVYQDEDGQFDGSLHVQQIELPPQFWIAWFESNQELGGVVADLVTPEDEVDSAEGAYTLAVARGWIK